MTSALSDSETTPVRSTWIPPWTAKAACAARVAAGQPDLHTDYSGTFEDARAARRICIVGCPVWTSCHEWASSPEFRWSGVTVAGHTFPGGGPNGRVMPSREEVLARARHDLRQARRGRKDDQTAPQPDTPREMVVA